MVEGIAWASTTLCDGRREGNALGRGCWSSTAKGALGFLRSLRNLRCYWSWVALLESWLWGTARER